jgi:parallel beta-helix repeat protein
LCSKNTSKALVNHITTIAITYRTEKGERLVKLNRLGIFVMVFLLVGIFAYADQTQKAEAADSPPLTINADGSITPSTTLITSTDNITYTFTDNITTNSGYQAINILRDNIILDGAGYVVQHVNRYSGIYVGNRNNVTLKNIKIIDCGDGISLNADTWLTIDNCTLQGNYRAIMNGYTDGPKNFTFTNNKIIAPLPARTRDGANFGSVNDALISENTIQHCGYGLVVYGHENVTIKNNLIDDCTWGIWPLSSEFPNISVFDNTFSNNGCGVCVNGGNHTGLKVYHNRFFNNNEHARGEGAILQWDDGYPSGGNYWSGFVSPDLYTGEYQNVTGGDGIGDTPFIIPLPFNVKDRYPFMFVSICNVSQSPPEGSVFSTDTVSVNASVTHLNPLEQVILNCTYTNSNATWTSIINMTNLEGDIWNGIIQALPVGTNVTYVIIAQDNVGNSINSISQGYTFEYPVVIPEFPAIALLPILFGATLFAALVYRRKRMTRFH